MYSMRNLCPLLIFNRSVGTKLHSLGITAMNIGLFVLCLFLSYVFSYFLSLFTILAFNCAILLIHRLMGPHWIFQIFYALLEYFYVVIFFMVQHYYFTSFLISVIFVWSLVSSILRIFNRNESSQVRHLREEVIELISKVDSVESKLDEIVQTLARIETLVME